MALIPENSPDAVTLEGLIDTHGLHNVLAAIEDICSAKADHVLQNWNDNDLALAWAKNSALIDKARSKLHATE